MNYQNNLTKVTKVIEITEDLKKAEELNSYYLNGWSKPDDLFVIGYRGYRDHRELRKLKNKIFESWIADRRLMDC